MQHLLTLLALSSLLLLGCNHSSSMVRPQTFQTIRDETSIDVSNSTVSMVPKTKNMTKFNCTFFRQPETQRLLQSNQAHGKVTETISTIYNISNTDIRIYPSLQRTDSHYYYEWETTHNHWGEIRHTSTGTEETVELVDSYVLDLTPRAFALVNIFKCLGIPTSSRTLLMTIDNSDPRDYGGEVLGLAFFYEETNMVLKLALLPSLPNHGINIDTKAYLIGIEVNHKAGSEAGSIPFTPWPPTNWSTIQ